MNESIFYEMAVVKTGNNLCALFFFFKYSRSGNRYNKNVLFLEKGGGGGQGSSDLDKTASKNICVFRFCCDTEFAEGSTYCPHLYND